MLWFWSVAGVGLLVLLIHDLFQRKHTLLRNFPIIGHFRYWLEALGPELRQYIVASNNEERPFTRDQRSWIYASSKKENDYFGFGTDEDLEQSPNYIIVKQSTFPLLEALPGEPSYDPTHQIPCAKVLGGFRGRKRAFRPRSIINLSAMSYGSLSLNAVTALNRGAKLANCLHNTGEGGLAKPHLEGGELIWQIGTGYFGCRDDKGRFDMAKFLDKTQRFPVRAVEVKLSQGAKPGLGGVLPAAKVTAEISDIRGVPLGKDCVSPAAHSAFTNVDELLDFVELLADKSGLPVGIKSAVGHTEFWELLAERIQKTGRSVDFITIDGGEGGTGAAPLVFTDHVSFPYKIGFTKVYREFAKRGLQRNIVFIGSGKLGFPEQALMAMSLGADMVNVAREALLSVGCIQAQKCHTNKCPTGVATQSKWLMRGLDPQLKSARFANYVTVLRKEILRLSRACGKPHPSLVTSDHIDLIDDYYKCHSLTEMFGYEASWTIPSEKDVALVAELMKHPTEIPKPNEAPRLADPAVVEHTAIDKPSPEKGSPVKTND